MRAHLPVSISWASHKNGRREGKGEKKRNCGLGISLSTLAGKVDMSHWDYSSEFQH